MTLAEPDTHDGHWIDYNSYVRQLEVARDQVLGTGDSGAKAFYDLVIAPLVDLQRSAKDNLYSWLEVMLAFCSGKPFAYYSRYVPSPRIFAIASRHRVTLRHFPLRLLPTRLVERNRSFRFTCR